MIIDPIASFIDRGLDMAKNEQIRSILQRLIALAQESNASIIPVYHTGKARQGALGSVAFEDACRFVLTAAKDDEYEDVRHPELTKSAVGRMGEGRNFRIVEVPVEIEGETSGVAKLDEAPAQQGRWRLIGSSCLSRRPQPLLVASTTQRIEVRHVRRSQDGTNALAPRDDQVREIR